MTDAPEFLSAAELLDEQHTIGTTGGLVTTPPPKLTGPKAPAPKRKPPEPAADPLKAPHGWVYRDGAWRARKPAGRPAGAKKAPGRVAGGTTPPPATSQAAKASAAVLGQVAAELAEGIGMVAATAPLPPSPLRVRLRLQAAILTEHAAAIGAAAAKAAPHVPFVDRMLSRLAAGSGGAWVVPVVMALSPVVMASVEVWRTPMDDTLVKAAEEVEASAHAQLRAIFSGVAAAAAQGGQEPQ